MRIGAGTCKDLIRIQPLILIENPEPPQQNKGHSDPSLSYSWCTRFSSSASNATSSSCRCSFHMVRGLGHARQSRRSTVVDVGYCQDHDSTDLGAFVSSYFAWTTSHRKFVGVHGLWASSSGLQGRLCECSDSNVFWGVAAAGVISGLYSGSLCTLSLLSLSLLLYIYIYMYIYIYIYIEGS